MRSIEPGFKNLLDRYTKLRLTTVLQKNNTEKH